MKFDLKGYVMREPGKPDANVPCNGCTACCRGGMLIMVSPHYGDDVASYDTISIREWAGGDPKAPEGYILRQKPDGTCIYLNERGCSIHPRQPYLCRTFDCRVERLRYTREERRRMLRRGELDPKVMEAAERLLNSQGKR